MPIKLYCDIEGMEQNYIEVKENWTQAEYLSLGDPNVKDEHYLKLLRGKGVSCHLELADGSVINRVEDITEETLKGAEMRLIGFVFSVPIRACTVLRSLGNVAARLYSAGSENKSTVAPTTNGKPVTSTPTPAS